jgi:hypothetical protein
MLTGDLIKRHMHLKAHLHVMTYATMEKAYNGKLMNT